MYVCISLSLSLFLSPSIYINNNYEAEKFAPMVKARRRENMVGVNMVLTYFVKFKHRLCRSCGIECLDGMLLEPC